METEMTIQKAIEILEGNAEKRRNVMDDLNSIVNRIAFIQILAREDDVAAWAMNEKLHKNAEFIAMFEAFLSDCLA